MTIVNNSAADGFIQRLPRDLRFFLVHGSDEGLAHERSKAIAHIALAGDSDPLRLVRLEGDTVARDPGVLADEAYAISMFGGSRVIWIDAQGRDLQPALTPLFAKPPNDCIIIVKSGQLKKGAGLRDAFERMKDGASIECYEDETRALGPLIDAEMRAAGLEIAHDARAALQALLGADRQTTRNEIAKLILYARGRSRIEVADVEAAVSDAAPSGLDDLIDLALAGDLPGVESHAARFFHEGGEANILMSRLIARLTLLHRLRLETDQGRSFDAACQALFVRLPPAARRALASQAERWTSESIAQRLPAMRAASARVRTEPRLAGYLAMRALWALGSRSRGGRS
jgi:DNA polymerase-3 subunit delta